MFVLLTMICLLTAVATTIAARRDEGDSKRSSDGPGDSAAIEGGVVDCANLIYGRHKTSVCFSHDFLIHAEKISNIRTTRRFTPVEMDSQELYLHPFAIMTGEGRFKLTDAQRDNLRGYLLAGGFVVASGGCSNYLWNQSFHDEIERVFPNIKLKRLPMTHPVFHTIYDIDFLTAKKSGSNPYLEALIIDGRIVLVYSKDGLNDTANAGPNCCCCGGNEIRNARQVNVNLLAYALTH